MMPIIIFILVWPLGTTFLQWGLSLYIGTAKAMYVSIAFDLIGGILLSVWAYHQR
jgi:glucose uptake protein GlcU